MIKLILLLVCLVAPVVLGGSGELSGEIRVDGSSTVFPIAEAIAEEFSKLHPKVRVMVGFSGTGGGFKKFCRGEIDISLASRPVKSSEIELCELHGVEFMELVVAFDGITVVVHPSNTWAECMTVQELKKLWEPAAEGKITKWSQIRPGWPDEPIRLFGPGVASGTFDYFTEVISGSEDASRGDFFASEDDHVLVMGVAGDPQALGYFGYAYYEANKDKLKALAIDAGEGCVLPSRETIAKGTYKPLSRPLFIYPSLEATQRKAVDEFVRFFLSEEARPIIDEVGYVSLTAKLYEIVSQCYSKRVKGSAMAKDGGNLIKLYSEWCDLN
jgi:phosphate transport system substrate-binding protein